MNINLFFRSLKLFYILLLVVLFVVYFGTPNLKKFLQQKTIFLESKIKDKMLEHLLKFLIINIIFFSKIETETATTYISKAFCVDERSKLHIN